METSAHEVGDSGSKYLGHNDTSFDGEDALYNNASKPGTENDESTIPEATDQENDASVAPSENAVSVIVIGFSYGVRSSGSVMPAVMAGFGKSSSLDLPPNMAVQSGDIKGCTDPTMLPPFSVPTQITADTQRTVYSQVEMLHMANKLPNPDLDRTMNAIAGETGRYNSSNYHSATDFEDYMIGSASDLITSNGNNTVDEEQNLFPAEQPIIQCFANHDITRFDNGYGSDGHLPLWDPIAEENDPDDDVEDANEETSLAVDDP
eukprot:4600220-Ditylum_brightwellii.AAC.1